MKQIVSFLIGIFSLFSLCAENTSPNKLLYDFIVAQDGSGDFMSVQEAVDAVPDFRKRETRIFIKEGIYKEKIVIAGSKQDITFIGKDPKQTILTYDDFAQKKNRFGEEIGTSGSASVFIYGSGFKAVNITFENTSGPVGQAVACYTLGDKAIFYNCRFLGFQDTLYAAGEGARQYFENCYIEGTTDFIFGSATAWFEKCHIHCKKNSFITAANTPENVQYGYIFNNCIISGDPEIKQVFLGRPWRPYSMSLFMNCFLPDFIHPDGWDPWRKESNKATARYSEYNNYGPGATTDKRVTWIKILTDNEAKKIDLKNVMKGEDKWYPHIIQTDTLVIPAFKGAEGSGMYTTGGRGGKTYFVTSLEDTIVGDKKTRSGTLRWCIKQEGPRTILFRVAGIIRLKAPLDIESNTSLLGHSAPGNGICIADNSVRVDGDNVIVRYLRFRMGDLTRHEGDAFYGNGKKNIIIDHCSISWATDECASFYDNENFTMQWCIISESLRQSVHHKGTHGYGAIWGGKKASYHHNLLACHDSRNPRFCGSRYSALPELELVDFRNNVIYNWGNNTGYAGEGGRYNIINNYYKAGKESSNKDRIFQPNADNGSNLQEAGVWGSFYLAGNYVDGYPDTTNDNSLGLQPNPKGTDKSTLLSDTPFPTPFIQTETAEEAYRSVLEKAGASYQRDKTDKRIVNEVRKGISPQKTKDKATARGLINSQSEVGGWDNYSFKPSQVLADSNNDGIPDGWLEKYYPGKEAHNCNEEGYTYIELYLEQLIR
ncbi:pectinesterase family protein [Bacteroidales bacterium OttesenSCG-928-A17]|nr:pectinesterase family protein [Bacteroidales bacterium OttesenSCG-928-A17]